MAQKIILDSHFKVFEVNHSRHTTKHTTKSLGTKSDMFQVVIAVKCLKKKVYLSYSAFLRSGGKTYIIISTNAFILFKRE